MEYEGKLYGKVGGEYFPMTETTEDINRYKQRIKELEEQEKNLNIDFVSQQRELLIEAFDLINIHDGDREKINKLVDITLKSINCG